MSRNHNAHVSVQNVHVSACAAHVVADVNAAARMLRPMDGTSKRLKSSPEVGLMGADSRRDRRGLFRDLSTRLELCCRGYQPAGISIRAIEGPPAPAWASLILSGAASL